MPRIFFVNCDSLPGSVLHSAHAIYICVLCSVDMLEMAFIYILYTHLFISLFSAILSSAAPHFCSRNFSLNASAFSLSLIKSCSRFFVFCCCKLGFFFGGIYIKATQSWTAPEPNHRFVSASLPSVSVVHLFVPVVKCTWR